MNGVKSVIRRRNSAELILHAVFEGERSNLHGVYIQRLFHVTNAVVESFPNAQNARRIRSVRVLRFYHGMNDQRREQKIPLRLLMKLLHSCVTSVKQQLVITSDCGHGPRSSGSRFDSKADGGRGVCERWRDGRSINL